MKKVQRLILIGCVFCLTVMGISLLYINIQKKEQLSAIQTTESYQHKVKQDYKKQQVAQKNLTQTLIEEMNSKIQSTSAMAGVVIYDVETKNKISLNGDLAFKAGGLFEVPLAMMIADKIKAGQLTLKSELPYDTSFYTSEQSDIAKNPKNSYTIEELLRLMLVSNDAIAYALLKNEVGGTSTLLTYMKEVYNSDQETKKEIMTANDAVSYLTILYDNPQGNDIYTKIQEWMMSADAQGLATEVVKDDLGHCYYKSTDYYHDIGIYYGKHPYIVAVLTKGDSDAERLVSELSDMIYYKLK